MITVYVLVKVLYLYCTLYPVFQCIYDFGIQTGIIVSYRFMHQNRITTELRLLVYHCISIWMTFFSLPLHLIMYFEYAFDVLIEYHYH